MVRVVKMIKCDYLRTIGRMVLIKIGDTLFYQFLVMYQGLEIQRRIKRLKSRAWKDLALVDHTH